MSVRKLLDLSGRVALVTGGSRGLGLQIAEGLGELGARLVITARKRHELDAAVARLKGQGADVLAVASDLQDPHAAKALVESAGGKATACGPGASRSGSTPRCSRPRGSSSSSKVRSGIAALVTTLRDPIDEEVFPAGAASVLRVVSQIAVGVDNIDRAAANRHRIPYTHTPDVLTDATAEYAFFMMGAVARRLYPAEVQVRAREWTTWHPYLPWLGDEVTGGTLAVSGMGRIGQSMANKAVAFDMDVLCHSTSRSAALGGFVSAVQRVKDLRYKS